MNKQVVALLIREGTQFVSQFLRFRSVDISSENPLVLMANKASELDEKERELIDSGGPPDEPWLKGLEASPKHSPVIAVEPSSVVAVTPKIVTEVPESTAELPTTEINEATAVPTGCVPCALGHYGACTGILNEAVRFVNGGEGMDSNEVLDRTGMCLDELNAMERKDLRPQMIVQLPDWEKELAEKALSESRLIRHRLENLTTADELTEIAGSVQQTRQELYRNWAKRRLKNMSSEEKTEMTERILTKLEEED